MDVRQSDLYRGSTIDEDVDGSSTLTDHQKMNMKEQGLRKILAVFDEVRYTQCRAPPIGEINACRWFSLYYRS